jgi:hypothetical protein
VARLPAGRIRLIATTVLAVGAAVLLAVGYLRAAETVENCKAVPSEAIIESAEFTPYETRLSHLPGGVPIVAGDELPAAPSSATFRVAQIAGLGRRHTIALSNGSVYAYFHDRPMSGLTVPEFRLQGGIEFDQDPRDGNQPFAAALVRQFPTRATPVKVGQFDGAVTWGDPDENGTRTHNVYWSDAEFNYALITTEKSAAEALNLARSLVC